MAERNKVGYIGREELVDRIRKQFSPEYGEFLLIQAGYSPKVCPKCGSTSFTTLWLAKPNDAIDGKMWAKWYFWCDKCFAGNLSKNIADANVKREAAKLASEQCRYLAEEVIPSFQRFSEKYHQLKLTFLTALQIPNNPLMQIKDGEFINPNFNREALEKELPLIAKELLEYLNKLEYFAIVFAAGVADERVAFPVAGAPFMGGVNMCVVPLYHLRATGQGRFQSTMTLYSMWINRVAGAAAASLLPSMREWMKKAETNRVELIGISKPSNWQTMYSKLWLKLKPKDLAW
jgi:hypothetical protein